MFWQNSLHPSAAETHLWHLHLPYPADRKHTNTLNYHVMCKVQRLNPSNILAGQLSSVLPLPIKSSLLKRYSILEEFKRKIEILFSSTHNVLWFATICSKIATFHLSMFSTHNATAESHSWSNCNNKINVQNKHNFTGFTIVISTITITEIFNLANSIQICIFPYQFVKNICNKLTSLQLRVRMMWWYQSSKTAKIIWVTLDKAMHMASLQADFSW